MLLLEFQPAVHIGAIATERGATHYIYAPGSSPREEEMFGMSAVYDGMAELERTQEGLGRLPRCILKVSSEDADKMFLLTSGYYDFIRAGGDREMFVGKRWLWRKS